MTMSTIYTRDLRIPARNAAVNGRRNLKITVRPLKEAAVEAAELEAFERSPYQRARKALEAFEQHEASRAVTPQQHRMNGAWWLVRMGRKGLSKSTISRAANVSERQVAYMREVKGQLGTAAQEYHHWRDAKQAAAEAPAVQPQALPERPTETQARALRDPEDLAWLWVRIGRFSVKEISEAANLPVMHVKAMVTVVGILGGRNARTIHTWKEAFEAAMERKYRT